MYANTYLLMFMNASYIFMNVIKSYKLFMNA